jgi:DNA-binding NarL/FixJ family response regulator
VTASLAMAAARAGSARHAEELAALVGPYEAQWAATGGAVVLGPFALHLGRLAAVRGDEDEAARLLDAAAASAAAGGCAPWSARVALARAGVATDAGDRRWHARRAAELAEPLGMCDVAAAARRLLGEVPNPAGLTDREAEVLRLLASGATNAEIASRLYLSVKTVERHLLNTYRKAGVRNRAEAAAFALRELSS